MRIQHKATHLPSLTGEVQLLNLMNEAKTLAERVEATRQNWGWRRRQLK